VPEIPDSPDVTSTAMPLAESTDRLFVLNPRFLIPNEDDPRKPIYPPDVVEAQQADSAAILLIAHFEETLQQLRSITVGDTAVQLVLAENLTSDITSKINTAEIEHAENVMQQGTCSQWLLSGSDQ